MLRLALATSLLVLPALPAVSGNQAEYPHQHRAPYVGSFSVPINFRPLGQDYIVRTEAYDEDDTKKTGRRMPGKSVNPTGDPVTEILIRR